jgi:O-antigen ligase
MLFIISLTFPIFVHLLTRYPQKRSLAFTVLAGLLFFAGAIRLEAYFYGWPAWQGTVKGFALSPVDTLAIALIVTRRSRARAIPFAGLFAIYGLTLLISLIPATNAMAAAFSFWLLIRTFLLFAAISLEASKPEVVRALVTGLCIGLAIQAGYVLNQRFHGVVQASGTMPHQNILGMVTEAALLPCVAAMLGGDRRIHVRMGVIAGLTIVALGGSRATLGFTFFGLATLFVLSLLRGATPSKLRILGFAVILSLLAVPIGSATLKRRFGESSFAAPDNGRIALEREANMMAADHLLGVGANNFVLVGNVKGYAARAGVDPMEANRSKPTHNAYLLAKAETGWLGEIALIFLLLIPPYRGLRFGFAKKKGADGETALGSAMAVIVIALHSNYEYAIHMYNALSLTVLNIGIISSLLTFRRPNLRQERQQMFHGQFPNPNLALAAIGETSQHEDLGRAK